jgi:hypothetical protein
MVDKDDGRRKNAPKKQENPYSEDRFLRLLNHMQTI